MTGRRDRLRKLPRWITVGFAVALTVALMVPTSGATPTSDAQEAITAKWEAAGADASSLGAPSGDIYPVGAGFAQNFAGGKIFFSPETGARVLSGAVLDKYESLGGAAGSNLGFPNSDETAGLAHPESRLVTFAAADSPLIYFTPEHGAFVVRGPMNSGWDNLGSSQGPLGIPVEDEVYAGPVVSQKFSAGELSWSSANGQFTTVPPELADQLTDLQVRADPVAAIDYAWRAAGGAAGPLGVAKGDVYAIDDRGNGQDFGGGKIYFSPETGAGALTGDILAKYQSLDGPVGSDLGFPEGSETDGAVEGSRVAMFSAVDKPLIFTAPDSGAAVVRGAMRTAWDALEGAAGRLGAPTADQEVDGDTVMQPFVGGKVMWDRATNTFSTQPRDLATSLAGLQIPGVDVPSLSNATTSGGDSHWNFRPLLITVAVLLLLGALAWALQQWLQRLRPGSDSGDASTAPEPRRWRRRSGDEDHWTRPEPAPDGIVRLPSHYDERAAIDLGDEAPPRSSDDAGGDTDRDPDAVDTEPQPATVLAESGQEYHAGSDLLSERHAAERPEEHRLDAYRERYGESGGDPFGPHLGEGVPEYSPEPVDEPGSQRYGAAEHTEPGSQPLAERYGVAESLSERDVGSQPVGRHASVQPMMRLPLDDPYQAPSGYLVKANLGSGLYYTPAHEQYDQMPAEIWFADEHAAQLNGFNKAQ